MFGVSRSATAVIGNLNQIYQYNINIAYLMKYHHMSYFKAKNKVEVKRQECNPNQGFLN